MTKTEKRVDCAVSIAGACFVIGGTYYAQPGFTLAATGAVMIAMVLISRVGNDMDRVARIPNPQSLEDSE